MKKVTRILKLDEIISRDHKAFLDRNAVVSRHIIK